ncbi:MAG: divalent-cation tolerance protein CutA [Wolbachia endosymbiont of Tyrophagus putrescentiae]|nr:divalent-cation tolerance protein CutA [Wolbachia endosymbiont of Tyrophagus putrescentiae]
MGNLVLVYIAFPGFEEAKAVSKELLEARLVICVNIFPEVSSFYLWKGEINTSSEVVAIMKSTSDLVDKITEGIESRHSYGQPIIAVIPIERANRFFVNWVNDVIGM